MADLTSSGDADVDAAFSGAPTLNLPAGDAVSTGDPDVDAAIKGMASSTDTKTETKKSRGVYDPDRPAIGDSVEQVLHEMASGAYHSVVGGYKGLAQLAATRNADEAADTVSAEQAKAYRAPDSGLSEAAHSDYNPMNWPGLAGRKAGAAAADAGASPGLSTALEVAPQAAAMALGMRGRTALSESGAPAAVDAQTVLNKASETQSQGAAAVPIDASEASPGVQAKIAATAPKDIDPDALTRRIEAEKNGIDLTTAQANRNSTLWADEKNNQLPEFTKRFSDQNKQLVSRYADIRRDAAPTTVGNDAIQNGQQVVDALKAYDEPVRADIKAKYQALADANGGTIPVDGKLFATQAHDALVSNNSDVFLPKEVQTLMDRASNNTSFSYNNFENLRTQLATAARNATDGNVKHSIGVVRDTLEQLPMGEVAAPIKALADTARTAARTRFEALEADPAYEAAVDDVSDGIKKGQASPLADRFLDKYALGSAPKSQVQLMMQKIGSDPDATGAVASHALNFIRDKAGISADNPERSTFSEHGFNVSGIQKLSPKLETLVGSDTAESVRSLGRTATNVLRTPPEAPVNFSRSGTLSNAAQGVAHVTSEAAGAFANAHTLGMATPILKGVLKANADKRLIERSLSPGGGINRND